MEPTMRFVRLLLLVVAVLVASGGQAAAADIRSGDTITVGAGETIDDDLYAFGGTISILGTVRGDVIAFSGTVIISGTVTGDVIAASGSLSVGGQVDGSVRAAGGPVAIDGRIGGDVVVGSGTLTVGANAQVTRDILVASGTVTHSGQLGRDLRAAAGTLTIDGRVGRDVNADVENLTLSTRALIEGSLTYASANEAVIPPGAAVRGPVVRREPVRQNEPATVPGPLAPIIEWAQAIVGFLVFGLLIVFIVPGFARRANDSLVRSPLVSLGVGAGVLIGLPVIAILVLIVGAFTGGWWIGLIALALYCIAIAASIPVVGLAIGTRIVPRTGRAWQLAIALVIGLAALLLVALVPVLGAVVILVAILAGLGAIVQAVAAGRTAAPVAIP
jgi:cytoskeletal protein CcmA (bactofilin family)